MPISRQTSELDDDDFYHPYSSPRPETIDDRFGREIYVIAQGTKDALVQSGERLPEIAAEIGGSAAMGFAVRAAEAKLPWLRPAVAIGGLALTFSAVKDLVRPAGEIGAVLKDSWNTADNLEANRAKFAQTGGKFAIDLTLTTASGLAGSTLANHTIFGPHSNYLRIKTYEPNSSTGPRARLYSRQDEDALNFLSTHESVFKLRAGKVPKGVLNYSANGFAASEDLIVTNAHVVAGKIEIKAFDLDGFGRRAKVVAEDRVNDLAVLQIPGAKFKPLSLAEVAAKPGDRVLPVSHQVGVKGLTIGPGEIGTIEQMPVRVVPHGTITRTIDPSHYYPDNHTFKFRLSPEPETQLSASERMFGNYFSQHGASGSPLLNRKGEVAGILSGAMPSPHAESNYAIPAKSIAAILEQARKNIASEK